MYFGACERISYYIENCYHEQQNETCKYTIFRLSSSSLNNGRRLLYTSFWICLCFEDEPLPASWPQYGNIEFRSVSLKHPTQNENFIADLNLTIPAGQRVSVEYLEFAMLWECEAKFRGEFSQEFRENRHRHRGNLVCHEFRMWARISVVGNRKIPSILPAEIPINVELIHHSYKSSFPFTINVFSFNQKSHNPNFPVFLIQIIPISLSTGNLANSITCYPIAITFWFFHQLPFRRFMISCWKDVRLHSFLVDTTERRLLVMWSDISWFFSASVW